MKRSLLLFLILSGVFLSAGEKKKIRYEQIFDGKGFFRLTSPLPALQGWWDDSHYILSEEGKSWKVDLSSGKRELLFDPKEASFIEEQGFSLSFAEDRPELTAARPSHGRYLFLKEGDLYMADTKVKTLEALTKSPGKESVPRLSPDGSRAAYVLDGNLFVYDSLSHKTLQITKDGCEEILNGYASWIYYEEILGRGSRYRAYWWSPDSRKIAFLRFDQSKVPVFPLFNAEGDYGDLERERYPKPGYPNPEVTLGIADTLTGEVTWIDVPESKGNFVAFPLWEKGGKSLLFQWMNHGQDRLKVYRYSLADRRLKRVYQEEQKSWVEFLSDENLIPLSDGGFLLVSDKNGWGHILHIDKNGKERFVTSGDWSVREIELWNEKSKTIFFLGSKEDSTQTHLYSIGLNGKNLKRLTDGAGSHFPLLSPQGSYFVDSWSSVSTPARMDLRDRRGRLLKTLGDSSVNAPMNDYSLGKVELFRITTSDGWKLPALWTLPPDFAPTKKYPVLIKIYGGPGAPSVANAFPRRANDFFYAQEGIIVLSVDHRGSGHFGKKGSALMHRCLGHWEMNDYIDTVKYLRTLPFVDPARIGITGGSYGGYVTAMAMTYGADYFSFGIADFSVIDWRLYDSVYTERFMDTPQENPEGYKNGSVLSYLDRYKGGLRITHGSMDDNVHMQNTLQFINKMMDLGKPVEMMVYPGERHGYRGVKGNYQAKRDWEFWKKNLLGQ